LQFGYFVGYFPPSSVVLLLWLSYQQIVVAEKLLHCSKISLTGKVCKKMNFIEYDFGYKKYLNVFPLFVL
jgi:hypothetical protein